MSPALRFVVSPEVFARRPDYIVGCVAAFGVNNVPAHADIDQQLAAAEEVVRAAAPDGDAKGLPEIALWRTVFGALGWSPSKYPASIEALVKRVLKGNSLPRINALVDLGNAVALRTRVPIGAHDLAQLGAAPLEVRLARPDDVFQPMGDAPSESPDADEIVYAVGSRVRTRRWVWRQAGDALVTASTTDVFFPVDGFSSVTEAQAREAVALLAEACAALLGARVTTGFVSTSTPSFSAES